MQFIGRGWSAPANETYLFYRLDIHKKYTCLSI